MNKVEAEQELSFGPYRVAESHGPLFRHSQIVNVPPKVLAVLWQLAQRAGQVVTRDELLAAVWAETVVGEEVLTVCMRTLRQALREDSTQPRYIATIHGVGYRFIAPLTTAPPGTNSQSSVVSREEERQRKKSKRQKAKIEIPAPNPQPLAPSLVGRKTELEQLHELFGKVLNGQRQVVFVTGEAGIGKTTLVEAFLTQIGAEHTPLLLGRGQCVEHYGAGEAYLPVLEVLGRLCRHSESRRLLDVLHRVAPTWLVQLPAVLSEVEYAALQQKEVGTTRERMLREMTEVVEELSVEQPLVLVLEDLHWSDVSTLDLLAMVAQRREAARLLILGTYRPTELIVKNHPLKTMKHELVARGQAREVVLGYLKPEAVQAYVARRFVDRPVDEALAAFVYRRTEGHPLFMAQMTDYLVQQSPPSPAAWQTAPQGLHQLIDAQLGRLAAEEQQMLEIASVAGAEFAVASVAAGLQTAPERIEECCERLAQQGQFLEDRGLVEWPDGTASGRYGFRHALYQEVLYKRMGTGRQARVHRLIATREEAGYGEWVGEIATELAVHFERGREYQRAVYYRRHAAESALQRNAYQEAVVHCTTGLALLRSLPDTAEGVQLELSLQMTLGIALAATKGYAAAEVEQAYLRARVLCERGGESAQLYRVLRGLIILYTVRANFSAARELGEQLLTLAQQANNTALLELSHMLLGVVRLWLGELSAAHEHFLHGATFADPDQNPRQRQAQAIRNGQDQRVALLAHDTWALWLLGYPEQARRANDEALRLARALAHPFTEAFALIYGAGVEQFCAADHAAQQLAAAALALADEQDFTFLAARGKSVEGWVLAQQGQVEEGITQMRRSLAMYKTLGIERGLPHFMAVLAEAYGKAGQGEEGLILVAQALAALASSGERWWEAELWRIKGELLLKVERGRQTDEPKTKTPVE